MKYLNQQSKKILRIIGASFLLLYILTQFFTKYENISIYFLTASCVAFAIILLQSLTIYLKDNYFK